MKILVLSSYTKGQQKSDDCIRFEDLEPPVRLENRIKELSGYSAPAGEMFTGALHTQLRQGLKQIRKHDQYSENTLDLYFPSYDFRVDKKKIPVSENDHIVPFNITPRQDLKPLEYDETGFLESLVTLIEGYDLVLSILRWNDIVLLQRVFEVERAATLIFLIAPSRRHVVDDSLSNVHIVEAGTKLSRAIGAMNIALNGVVLRKLCEAACRDGFHIFKQVEQDPQRLIEIVLRDR
ncbi:hypothetical protein F4054_11765 [Candidatus Poribacteria bacterium]|nr:hypothetical protein [Candidatus Poribacteria bacterium]MYG07961.1 hypothetical protein [Candidatus Poribacteria bacterium]MYK22922.1 hypothetical protein [Candidatus Poribacteria bacterium]